MPTTLSITSGKLSKDMPADERECTPFELDLKLKSNAANEFTVTADVGFVPIGLEKLVGQGRWYIGVTQVTVKLWARSGEIGACTEGTTIAVTYTKTISKDAAAEFKIKPEFQVAPETKLKVGEIGIKLGKGEKLQAVYSKIESDLSMTKAHDWVQWERIKGADPANGPGYLDGNLSLSADCKWPSDDKKGEVELYIFPSLFDRDRKIFSRGKSILMRFILYNNRKSLRNESGTTVRFKIA